MADLTWAGASYGAALGFLFLAGAALIRTKPWWLPLGLAVFAAISLMVAVNKDDNAEAAIRAAEHPGDVAPILGKPSERERVEFTLTREQPTWQVGLRAAPYFRYELSNHGEHLAAYLVLPARGNPLGWAPPPLQPMALADLEDYQQPGLGNPVTPGRDQFEQLTAQVAHTPNLARLDLPPATRAVHDCLWPHATPPVLVVHWYRPPGKEDAAAVPVTLEFATRVIDPDAVAVRKLLFGAVGAVAGGVAGFVFFWMLAERLFFLRGGFRTLRRSP